MKSKITIKCICGKEVVLELIGGQYQDSYKGDCTCGRRWFLEDLSEGLSEELPKNLNKISIE